MLKTIASLYRPLFVRSIVYMLQATEYNISAYLAWFWRTSDFGKIMYRKELVKTRPAKLLLAALWLGILLQIFLALALAWLAWRRHEAYLWFVALAIFLPTPVLWAHLIVLPMLLGGWLIIKPYSRFSIRSARQIFAKHPSIKIAIAGSYGKTTMKEILLTVLSQGKKVSATPANRNVAISHAQFAKNLRGDEDILVIEYGEGAPGDVEGFAKNTHPNTGIITGLAPAHLDKYGTLQAAGKDIFALADYLHDKQVFVNGESQALKPFIKKPHQLYSASGALDWKVSSARTSIEGLNFTMKKGNKVLKLKSHLLGRHLIGTLALTVALADKLGLSTREIVAGVSKIRPFEHRMKPYQLGGAWIIDDTYNGNLEGVKAGLQLLKELPFKRKIYVTPGLVDQGTETENVHEKIGRYIAAANPDIVVLMQHSVTPYIQKGIEAGKYQGQVRLETDPLDFYTNLEHLVAAGDLVLMQNDWSDQYE